MLSNITEQLGKTVKVALDQEAVSPGEYGTEHSYSPHSASKRGGKKARTSAGKTAYLHAEKLPAHTKACLFQVVVISSQMQEPDLINRPNFINRVPL